MFTTKGGVARVGVTGVGVVVEVKATLTAGHNKTAANPHSNAGAHRRELVSQITPQAVIMVATTAEATTTVTTTMVEIEVVVAAKHVHARISLSSRKRAKDWCGAFFIMLLSSL